MEVEKQVAIIYASTKGFMDNVPLNKVKQYEEEYLNNLETQHQKTLDQLRQGNMNEEIIKVLEKVAQEIAKRYQ